MKGIVLAGGSGTRLYPLNMGVTKQLLPVFNKPMIYYPVSLLMLAGIREILIISRPEDLDAFKSIFAGGEAFGLEITYAVQPSPDGLAQAFSIGEDFIGNESVCLVLGDNFFYGQGLVEKLRFGAQLKKGSIIFGYEVEDPENYGVVEFSEDFGIKSIQEKPKNPSSNTIVTGIYFYDHTVVSKAKHVSPSPRGELEITSINNMYLDEKQLNIEVMGRGVAWMDMGTHEKLLSTANFVQSIEKMQGKMIACLEEISLTNGWIDISIIEKKVRQNKKNSYNLYLDKLVKSHRLTNKS